MTDEEIQKKILDSLRRRGDVYSLESEIGIGKLDKNLDILEDEGKISITSEYTKSDGRRRGLWKIED